MNRLSFDQSFDLEVFRDEILDVRVAGAKVLDNDFPEPVVVIVEEHSSVLESGWQPVLDELTQ